MMNVEYVKDGINKVESGFETFEEIEKFVEENNLDENEYRITE